MQNEQNLEMDVGKEKLLKVGLEEEFGEELGWGDGKDFHPYPALS